MHQLYPIQSQFVTVLAREVRSSQSVIACYPTGGGKTVIFAHISASANAKGATVLILTESIKIFDQTPKQLHGNVHLINSTCKHTYILPGHTYLAMAQTLRNRPKIVTQLAALCNRLLIIVDEAHIGTTTSCISHFPDALRLGFTATPDWRSGKHLPKLYRSCIVGAQVQDLIDLGQLMPYRHYMRSGADISMLKIQSGEFTEASQEAAFETGELYAGLENDLRQQTYRKAMVFCASIKHCEDTAAQLKQAGFACVAIHSQNPNATHDLNMFMDLASGVDICVSVGMMTKGFDFPPIDLICLVRATTSLPLLLQMIGRGSRRSPATGKTQFTVLDYGTNGARLGLWNQDRDWQNMWKEQKRRKNDKEGPAPVKECPKCHALIPSSARNCPYCTAQLPPTEKELKEGELIELTAGYNALRGKWVSQLTAPELATYAKHLPQRRNYCMRVARSNHQRDGSFLIAYCTAMNYKENAVTYQTSLIPNEPIPFADILIR